jgi:hypothetical protein
MTAPVVELSDLLKEEIDTSVVCEWENIAEDDSCDLRAEWAILFKEICSHGSKCRPPYLVLFCDKHKKIILSLFTPWSGYRCGGCNCPLTGMDHLVKRVTKL